jgi:hypothetical protein
MPLLEVRGLRGEVAAAVELKAATVDEISTSRRVGSLAKVVSKA